MQNGLSHRGYFLRVYLRHGETRGTGLSAGCWPDGDLYFNKKHRDAWGLPTISVFLCHVGYQLTVQEIGNAAQEERLTYTVARNGTDGRDFHTGRAVILILNKMRAFVRDFQFPDKFCFVSESIINIPNSVDYFLGQQLQGAKDRPGCARQAISVSWLVLPYCVRIV